MVAITVSSKYQIVIPREVRDKLNITPGSRLQVTQDEHGLHLVKEPETNEIRGLLKGLPVMDGDIRDESSRTMP